MRGLLRGLVVIVLATVAAPGQVRVKVHTNRTSYPVGEPIVVVVHATNVDDEPIGYDQCCEGSLNGIDLSVPNGRRKSPPDLGVCNSGFERGSAGAIFHVPVFASGETVSFRYLLKDYRLEAGTYTLLAKGDAPVRWFFGAGHNHSVVSDRNQSDVVEGKHFDVGLPITVREGTTEELQRRFEPYLQAAQEGFGMTRPSRQAREAIAEMAPAFLEKEILEFANQPETAELAVKGLAQIPTASSRKSLIALYDAAKTSHCVSRSYGSLRRLLLLLNARSSPAFCPAAAPHSTTRRAFGPPWDSAVWADPAPQPRLTLRAPTPKYAIPLSQLWVTLERKPQSPSCFVITQTNR